MTINGQFKTRGYDGTQQLQTLRDFAQEHTIKAITRVGTSTRDIVYVVAFANEDGTVGLQQVTGGLYDFMDFTSEEDLKAYNNMSDRVRKALGAYSNKYHTQG